MSSLFGTIQPGNYEWGGSLDDELAKPVVVPLVNINNAGRTFVILTLDDFPEGAVSVQVEQRRLKNKRPASLWRIVKKGIKKAGQVKINNLMANAEYEFRFKVIT